MGGFSKGKMTVIEAEKYILTPKKFDKLRKGDLLFWNTYSEEYVLYTDKHSKIVTDFAVYKMGYDLETRNFDIERTTFGAI